MVKPLFLYIIWILIIPLTKKEVNQHWSYLISKKNIEVIRTVQSWIWSHVFTTKKGKKKLATAQTPQNQELDARLKGELIIFPTMCNKILSKGIVHRFYEVQYITTDHADDGDVYYSKSIYTTPIKFGSINLGLDLDIK
jgi:hypothetical protein